MVTPSPSDEEDTTQSPSVGQQFDKVSQNIGDVAVGAAKGFLNTAVHVTNPIRKLGNKIGDAVAGAFGIKTHPVEDIIPETMYTPQNTAEKVGFGGEQVIEFLAPTEFLKEAEIAIDAASKANKLGKFTQAAIRIGSKATAEAAAGATVRAAQTGGNVSETTKAALLFGLTKLGTTVVGETLKATGLPERLYNTVFKSTYDDALNELKTTGLNELKTADPELFKVATERGIIKTTNGQVVLDERLAKEALDRGLKGNLQNMANAVIKGQVKSEVLAQDVAKGYQGTIEVSEPYYYNVLKKIEEKYLDVAGGQFSSEARRFASMIKQTDGQLTGSDALALRRFFDKMRFASSYNADTANLSISQQNFKYLSNELRKRVNSIPGMKNIMKDYAFNIDALEALANEAKRRGNNQVLSLIDSIFFSTGLASGNPIAGASVGTVRKIINSPYGATTIGSAIEKGGSLSKPGAAVKGAASQINANQGRTERP